MDDEWDDYMRRYYVYRIFDASDRLLYIGCTSCVETRIYMHRATYTLVDAFLIHRHYDHHTSELIGKSLAEARAAERAAIKEERPVLNRQHNPTRWRKVDGQYHPVDAETLEAHQALSARPEPNPEFKAFLDGLFRKEPAA